MDGYKFYMINLKYSVDRKKTMDKMYNTDDLICVEAVDGNFLSDYEEIILPSNLDDIKNSRYTINNYEIACTASHIKAIKMAYENNETEVFIIEDDTHNIYKSIWKKTLKKIISEKPSDAECIIFFTSDSKLQKELIENSNDFVRYRSTKGTGVYYINKSGMKKICNHYIKDGYINLSLIEKRGDLLADGYAIYPKVNTYHYSKPTFIDECKTSTIHQRHITRHEINNNIIIDYFINNEYFPDSYEKKAIEEQRKQAHKEKREQTEKEKREETNINIMGMNELINYKISLLNEHSNECNCSTCKYLMKEIRLLLVEKQTKITI